MTHYFAIVNLVTLCEALVTSKAASIDLNTAYEATCISSGNSSVRETESQGVLNQSRDINFIIDLVVKQISVFREPACKHTVPLEVLLDVFLDGERRYGSGELSPDIIKRLEEQAGLKIRGEVSLSAIVDDEPEIQVFEAVPGRVESCGSRHFCVLRPNSYQDSACCKTWDNEIPCFVIANQGAIS